MLCFYGLREFSRNFLILQLELRITKLSFQSKTVAWCKLDFLVKVDEVSIISCLGSTEDLLDEQSLKSPERSQQKMLELD